MRSYVELFVPIAHALVQAGTTSTYAGQVIGLAKESIIECPRQRFWNDLRTFIIQCQENNETVIIMGDWNSQYNEVVNWMKHIGLKDIIHDRHKLPPPPTCKRSRSAPLDAVFAPESFQCWRSGFLSFEYLEGDHRGIWCDIPVEFLLGYNMQHPAHPKARRLKTMDPRVRKKYTKLLHMQLQQKNIYERIAQLYQSMRQKILPTDILNFEELDQTITEAMERAERKCRKLRTGTVKWSPLYQQSCDKVAYWTLLHKESLGQRVNKRKILSLRKKLHMTWEQGISAETIKLKLLTKQRKHGSNVRNTLLSYKWIIDTA